MSSTIFQFSPFCDTRGIFVTDNTHEGTEYLRNFVQQRFWINLLQKICFAFNKDKNDDLPTKQSSNDGSCDGDGRNTHRKSCCFDRLRQCINTLWFFGVKIGRRNENRFCCLFTCVTVRAVHVLIAPKFGTHWCWNAILKFKARRGKPKMMISIISIRERIEERLAQHRMRWKLNPMQLHTFEECAGTGQK